MAHPHGDVAHPGEDAGGCARCRSWSEEFQSKEERGDPGPSHLLPGSYPGEVLSRVWKRTRVRGVAVTLLVYLCAKPSDFCR